MASKDSKVTGLDNNAIYYEVSPTIICIMRLYNCLALLMVLIAFIICLVKGHDSDSNYLLACNLVLSGLIAIVVNWWYRRHELPADKYWYIFLLSSVIIFQTITTDIYVFHVLPTAAPTQHPPITLTTKPYTGTTVTWVTINSSTITPPPSAFPFQLMPPTN
ncbi:uncharacterized protein LOC132739576 [Ruditapes philippinarum]|uniref:uncharacterized protein LOC132739576 n=1 Tax=Ruditapes philippinarum TaxID=129788 RepID=UPI00295B2280|nr:uncharacterized protein LOC132739576 [Ruditapes philippinarum]